jgi:hypothetical protein
MVGIAPPAATASSPPARGLVGRVVSISGAYADLSLTAAHAGAEEDQATVGKFAGIISGRSVIIGLISEVKEEFHQTGQSERRSIARLELIGEIKSPAGGSAAFQRGINSYPNIGDGAAMLTDAQLRLIYGAADADRVDIGHLQQNPNIRVHIDIDDLVSRHFAIVGTTGVGKSSGVAIILQKILDTRPNLRIFLVDPHNEYGRCFGDKAQVLTPRNLRLPFWLFNFEEIVDAFFGGRPGVDEEDRNSLGGYSAGKSRLLAISQRRRPRSRQEARSARRRFHRGYTGALSRRGLDQPARRADGQAGKPFVAHDLSQADFADSNDPQSSALRLHVRERQYRRRHHGRHSVRNCFGCRRKASR